MRQQWFVKQMKSCPWVTLFVLDFRGNMHPGSTCALPLYFYPLWRFPLVTPSGVAIPAKGVVLH